MAKDYEVLFQKIVTRIEKEEIILLVRKRLAILFFIMTGSIVALIPALLTVRNNFMESGFLDFISLLFSDTNMVATYWKNFALALLESLPTVSVIVFLGTVLIFLYSLKFVIRDINYIYGLQ